MIAYYDCFCMVMGLLKCWQLLLAIQLNNVQENHLLNRIIKHTIIQIIFNFSYNYFYGFIWQSVAIRFRKLLTYRVSILFWYLSKLIIITLIFINSNIISFSVILQFDTYPVLKSSSPLSSTFHMILSVWSNKSKW
jgi:hypothetical protein